MFVLYQGGGTLLPATGSTSSTRSTENFVANLAIVGWFPDFKFFGADPCFAVTVPFASNRDTANFTVAAPMGPAQRFSLADEIASIADTVYSAILGWRAGEHHWNVIPTGIAPTGNFVPNGSSLTGVNRHALDLKGAYTYLGLRTGLEVTGTLGLTLNAPNAATNYQSGAELHFGWAVNQHFPLGLAAGVGGYVNQQVTNDPARATNSALSGDAWRPLVRCSAISSRQGPKRSTSAPGGFMSSMSKTGSEAT